MQNEKPNHTENEIGRFYAIGVGAGNPDFLTVRAANILSRIGVVFSVTSSSESSSTAFDIVSTYLKEDCQQIQLHFPMTRDKNLLKKAWEENAKTVLDVLTKNIDAAFITLGDPSIYSTYSYLWRSLVRLFPEVKVEVIPGITSFQAAAARLNIPLVEGDQSLTIVSGVNGADGIQDIVNHADNLVIMKIYRKWKEIVELIKRIDVVRAAPVISRCGMKGEKIWQDLRALDINKPPSYFTLSIVKK